MKKILILTYFFPPSNLAGSHRILSWATYLHNYGYYPIIVTRRWEDLTGLSTDISRGSGKEVLCEKNEHYEVHRLPYKQNLRDRIYTKYGEERFKYIRKFLSFAEVVFQNFFFRVVPYNNLYFYSKKLLRNDKSIEIALASGGPFSLFHFAHILNKKTGIPWIADYRDEWSINLLNKASSLPEKLIRMLEKRSEKKWVSSAELIISVSEVIANNIANFVKKPEAVVMNGFEESYFRDLSQKEQFKDFTITYNGTLYHVQKFEIFLSAFKNIVDFYRDKLKIRILFPGLAIDENLANKVRACMAGYEANLMITGRVTPAEIVDIQNQSHVLLGIAYNGTSGFFSTKIFEYLACKKPVILCPSDHDVMAELITKAGAGYLCDNEEEAEARLHLLIGEYLETGGIQCNSDTQFIQQFTREAQTQKLAEILDNVV